MWRRRSRCRSRAITWWWICKPPSFRGAREAGGPGTSRFRVRANARPGMTALLLRRAGRQHPRLQRDEDSDLIPRSLRSKRLERWAQRLDPRPSFETPRCAWLLRMRSEKRSVPAQEQIFDRAATKQPDGQISTSVVGQITFMTPDILSLRKGRWPSSRTLGRDAVDAAVSCARRDGRAGSLGS